MKDIIKGFASSAKTAVVLENVGNEIVESMKIHNEATKQGLEIVKDVKDIMRDLKPISESVGKMATFEYEKQAKEYELGENLRKLEAKRKEIEMEIEIERLKKTLNELRNSNPEGGEL